MAQHPKNVAMVARGLVRVSPPQPDLAAVGVQEAARLLSITPRTVERLIADGAMRSIRIRRRRLIPTSEIRRIVGDLSDAGMAQVTR